MFWWIKLHKKSFYFGKKILRWNLEFFNWPEGFNFDKIIFKNPQYWPVLISSALYCGSGSLIYFLCMVVLRDWSATEGIYSFISGICNMLNNWSRERNWEQGLQWIQNREIGFNTGMDEICKGSFPRIPLCQNILLELKMSKQNVLTLPNLDSSPWKSISFQEAIKLPGFSYASTSSFFSSPIIPPPLNIFMN